MKAGDRVERVSGGSRVGEIGIVEAVYVNDEPVKVKVKALNTNIKWNKQDAANFRKVSDLDVDSAANAFDRVHSPDIHPLMLAPQPLPPPPPPIPPPLNSLPKTGAFKVGDRVEKIDGGATGIVQAVYDSGKVKIAPENPSIKWNKQDNANFQPYIDTTTRSYANSKPQPCTSAKSYETKCGRCIFYGEDLKEKEKIREPINWNVSPDISFPSEFTRKSLCEFPDWSNDLTGCDWACNKYTSTMWRYVSKDMWSIRYPVLTQKDSTKTTHESSASSLQYLTDEITRDYHWQWLSHIDQYVPNQYANLFRVDIFGNVVAITAGERSLCALQIGHLFPWNRGGRTVNDNLIGAQADALTRVKGDNFIPNVDPVSMRCGITPKQVKSLLEYAHSKVKDDGDIMIGAYYDMVVHWLTLSPKKGTELTDFQTKVKGVVDGCALWLYFQKWFECQSDDEDFV